jgi:hypothetical protein
VLADGSEDRFLVLASTLTGDESSSDHPGSIHDLPVDGFASLFAYVVGTDPSPLQARGVRWRDNGVELSVPHIGSTPDDRLTERVADELASDPRFDFEVPASAMDAGFTPLGSATGSTDDLADYTVSWVPSEMAGEDRAAAVDAPDEGPTIFINVGARFYGQIAALGPGDAVTAPISRDGELLRLEFLMSGAPISVSGRAVTEEELRDFAASLVELDRDAWRRGLGDRLLIDDSDP